MTDDERLVDLLRAALPPTMADRPSSDLWPQVVDRIQAPPGWSWFDLALAAGIVAAMVVFPESLWLLGYHL